MAFKNDKTIFYNENGLCISQVVKQYVPNLNINIADTTLVSEYQLSKIWFCGIVDDVVLSYLVELACKTELNETECKLLDAARSAIANHIAFNLVQVRGVVGGSGDVNPNGEKYYATNDTQNQKNCYHLLNRAEDFLENFIYKCLCPLLAEENEAITALLPIDDLQFVKTIRQFVIASPAEYAQCENLSYGGRFSVFRKLRTHFKAAWRILMQCGCTDFWECLKAHHDKFTQTSENELLDELLALVQAYLAAFAKFKYNRKDSKTATNTGMQFITKNPYPFSRRIYESETSQFDSLYDEEQYELREEILRFIEQNKNEIGFEKWLACFPDIETGDDTEKCPKLENNGCKCGCNTCNKCACEVKIVTKYGTDTGNGYAF